MARLEIVVWLGETMKTSEVAWVRRCLASPPASQRAAQSASFEVTDVPSWIRRDKLDFEWGANEAAPAPTSGLCAPAVNTHMEDGEGCRIFTNSIPDRAEESTRRC